MMKHGFVVSGNQLIARFGGSFEKKKHSPIGPALLILSEHF
jgi:hypothetical protein